jgi:hypothetical protein
MRVSPTASRLRPRDVLTALGLSVAGTVVAGGVLFLLGENVWGLALGGLLSLFAAGAWLGWRAREPEPLYGALLNMLYFGVVAGVLFGGELAEALPDPLPGLAIGDSTFFFVSPLLMLLASVGGSVLGGSIGLHRRVQVKPGSGGANTETRLHGPHG